MMIRNILIALGIACLIAGGALSFVWINRIGNTPATTLTPARSAVLTASRSLPSGTLLRPDDLSWRETAAGDIRPGAIVRGQVSDDELVGAITRREIGAGEALANADLLKPSERHFLAAVLKPGTRAVSIAVDAPQSAAGLILPGDQVDVILTQNFSEQADPVRRSVAETILRNVRVIAIDQKLSPAANASNRALGGFIPGETANVPKTVTFEVTERQAERLFVAAQLGRLQLAVRPIESNGTDVTGGVGGPATWAWEVSPALGDLARKQQSGSSIENSIRRAPTVSQ